MCPPQPGLGGPRAGRVLPARAHEVRNRSTRASWHRLPACVCCHRLEAYATKPSWMPTKRTPYTVNGDLTTADLWDQTWTAPTVRTSRFVDRLRESVHWKFDRLLGGLFDVAGKPAAGILELGWAPGTILERIHRLRPRLRLHGIDYSADGCRLARERFRAAGMTVGLHEGDVRTVELPRRHDLVLSCG